jgi:uncharacterized metal-binding protein YceD (DUF177 family)
MERLVEFSIPVSGMGNGIHQFRFSIDDFFFSNFEGSPVESGAITVLLEFDKRPDMYVLDFNFEGTVKTECDRCLAPIDLPVSGREQLLVKFSLEDESENAEVVYVHPEIKKFNVARYIYEFLILAIPMIRVFACETLDPRPCNDDMLTYLEESASSDRQNEGQAQEDNPIWEELKKLSGDNN